MRVAVLIACLIALCGCADKGADLRTQAESQAGFMQGLSDDHFGKNSAPPTHRLDRFTHPTGPDEVIGPGPFHSMFGVDEGSANLLG